MHIRIHSETKTHRVDGIQHPKDMLIEPLANGGYRMQMVYYTPSSSAPDIIILTFEPEDLEYINKYLNP